jgi:hypothetical protein
MKTDDEHNPELIFNSQNMQYKYDYIRPVKKTSARFVYYYKHHALRKWVPLPSIRDLQFFLFIK